MGGFCCPGKGDQIRVGGFCYPGRGVQVRMGGDVQEKVPKEG